MGQSAGREQPPATRWQGPSKEHTARTKSWEWPLGQAPGVTVSVSLAMWLRLQLQTDGGHTALSQFCPLFLHRAESLGPISHIAENTGLPEVWLPSPHRSIGSRGPWQTSRHKAQHLSPKSPSGSALLADGGVCDDPPCGRGAEGVRAGDQPLSLEGGSGGDRKLADVRRQLIFGTAGSPAGAPGPGRPPSGRQMQTMSQSDRHDSHICDR